LAREKEPREKDPSLDFAAWSQKKDAKKKAGSELGNSVMGGGYQQNERQRENRGKGHLREKPWARRKPS